MIYLKVKTVGKLIARGLFFYPTIIIYSFLIHVIFIAIFYKKKEFTESIFHQSILDFYLFSISVLNQISPELYYTQNNCKVSRIRSLSRM